MVNLETEIFSLVFAKILKNELNTPLWEIMHFVITILYWFEQGRQKSASQHQVKYIGETLFILKRERRQISLLIKSKFKRIN